MTAVIIKGEKTEVSGDGDGCNSHNIGPQQIAASHSDSSNRCLWENITISP